MLLMLASCSKVNDSDIAALRALAHSTIEVIKNGDVEAAYELVDKEYYDKATMQEMIPKYSEYLGKFTSFEVKEMRGCTSKKTSGTTLVMAAFSVETDAEDFIITVSAKSGGNSLRGLSVTLMKDTEPTYTGTVTTMRGANVLQWFVLIIGLLAMVFSFAMLVDCVKRKIYYKPIWIIVILLSFFLIRVTIDPDKSVSVLFWLAFIINSGTLKYFSDGMIVLELIIPAGALVYFVMRRKLKVKGQRVYVGNGEVISEKKKPAVNETRETDKGSGEFFEEEGLFDVSDTEKNGGKE